MYDRILKIIIFILGDIVEIKIVRSQNPCLSALRNNRSMSDLGLSQSSSGQPKPQLNIMMQNKNNQILWKSPEEKNISNRTSEPLDSKTIFKSSFSVWRSPIISISINLN